MSSITRDTRCALVTGVQTCALPIGNVRLEWGEFTGRFGVVWQPQRYFTDQTLIYAFLSRGYKAGGMNPPSPGFATREELLSSGVITNPAQFELYELFFPGFSPVLQLKGAEYEPNFRSEEHTSELQSLMRISYDVFCLKKKKNKII